MKNNILLLFRLEMSSFEGKKNIGDRKVVRCPVTNEPCYNCYAYGTPCYNCRQFEEDGIVLKFMFVSWEEFRDKSFWGNIKKVDTYKEYLEYEEKQKEEE